MLLVFNVANCCAVAAHSGCVDLNKIKFWVVLTSTSVAAHSGCVDLNGIVALIALLFAVAAHSGCVDLNPLKLGIKKAPKLSQPTRAAWI